MVVLSRIERLRRQYQCRHRVGKLAGVVEVQLGLLGQRLLLVVVVENGSPVLRTAVGELASGVRRIDLPPEDLDEFLVAQLLRVKRYLTI